MRVLPKARRIVLYPGGSSAGGELCASLEGDVTPGFPVTAFIRLMPHADMPKVENRASSVRSRFRRSVHLGLGLGASSLSTAVVG